MAAPGRSIDPLVVGRVVGDVVDLFVPTVDVSVQYPCRRIANGCEIKPSAAVDRPLVHINGPRSSPDLFTLVMVDPDAPSPSEPNLREWLHWTVSDIPHGADASKGKEVVDYMGPKPPTGIHRYVFVLFKQGTSLRPDEIQWPDHSRAESSGGRGNFSTRRFAAANHLGLPVAAVYFNSQKEVARKLR